MANDWLKGVFAQVISARKEGSQVPPAKSMPCMNFGCALVIVVVVVLVGVIYLLQKAGCISSEEALRNGTKVEIAATEILEGKGLFVVRYRVTNNSDWPISAAIRWEVRPTTGPATEANETELRGIQPHKDSGEERVMFDLGKLRDAGIKDPQDKDYCRVNYRFMWVAESGKEPSK